MFEYKISTGSTQESSKHTCTVNISSPKFIQLSCTRNPSMVKLFASKDFTVAALPCAALQWRTSVLRDLNI